MILSLSLPGCARPVLVSSGGVFLGWTLASSVHPSILPYRKGGGWTDKRKASALVLRSPQAGRVTRIGG